MRRSNQVLAPLLASAALALLAGCKKYDKQSCVDEHNQVVDPSYCKDLPPNAQQPVAGTLSNNGGTYTNGVFYPHYYRFYYGGYNGGPGTIAGGGGYAPAPGHSYAITGTTRGGFGSSFSGGEGEGGHAGSGE